MSFHRPERAIRRLQLSRSRAEAGYGLSRATIAMLSFVTGVYAIQQTAVFTSFPAIRDDLGGSTEWSTWIFGAFLLTTATCTAIVGRLGDQYGKRRMLMIVLFVFFVGSLAAALAPSMAALIVARAVQGVGGAAIPLSIAIVRDAARPERVSGALGFLFAALSVAASLGVVIGGVVADQASWRLIFAFAVISMGVSLVCVYAFVPDPGQRAPTRIDFPGAVLLTLSVTAFLLALTEGEALGWTSAVILSLFGLTAIVIVAWVVVEQHSPVPMIEIALLRKRSVALANVASTAHSMTLFVVVAFLPLYLAAPGSLSPSEAARVDYGFDLSTSQIGLYMLPGFLIGLATGPFLGRWTRRFGTRFTLAGAMAAMALGCFSMALWNDEAWMLAVGFAVIGLGNPVAAASVATLLLSGVRATDSGVIAGFNQTVRTLSASLAIQVAAAILVAGTIGGTSIPSEAAYEAIFMLCGIAASGGVVVSGLVHKHDGRTTPEAR